MNKLRALIIIILTSFAMLSNAQEVSSKPNMGMEKRLNETQSIIVQKDNIILVVRAPKVSLVENPPVKLIVNDIWTLQREDESTKGELEKEGVVIYFKFKLINNDKFDSNLVLNSILFLSESDQTIKKYYNL